MTMTLEGRKAAVESGERRLAGESRKQEFRSELRAADTTKDDKTFVTLHGYASTVGVPYVMYDMFGEYTEVMDPHAFDKTLAANPDVAFLVNHTGLTMARTTNGTLRLSADEVGLLSEADLNPQRTDVQNLRHAIDDGNVDQMSFAFRIVSGLWSPDYTQYTITEVDLDRGDVSAVNYGANPDTSISARTKQALDAIATLTGAPLEIALQRAQARHAEIMPQNETHTGRSVSTVLALMSLED